MLKISAKSSRHTVSLKLEGSLKGPWVDELHRAWLAEAGSSDHKRDTYVDLAGVNFADSKGIGLLVQMQQHGVVLTGLSSFLQQLMHTRNTKSIPAMPIQ